MEPPPPSLEAMVQSSAEARDATGPSWLLWLALVGVAAAVTGYVLR
jgi:hypothetical protein